MALGNTTTVTLAFDAASRITGVRNAKSDGTEIAAYAYTRDNVGNPTAVALTGGDLLTFSYDANYRLTREQRSGANAYDVTYTFDQVGNRTAKIASGATTTCTYNAMDQLTTEQAPGGAITTYSFDAAGNNTVVNADGTYTTYTWDLANRMTGAALPAGGTVTVVYDATGLRRSREDASGLVHFVWDGQNVLQETDSGGTTQAQYTVASGTGVPAGGPYGPILSQRRGATSAFYHPNDLGTIEHLTDASQNVTDTYVLDAWGRSVSSSGSTTNPHRYIGSLGYYHDTALGLDYVRARWLRPATGSWVSVDPVLTEPRYGYVGGRPWQATDATGRGLSAAGDPLDPPLPRPPLHPPGDPLEPPLPRPECYFVVIRYPDGHTEEHLLCGWVLRGLRDGTDGPDNWERCMEEVLAWGLGRLWVTDDQAFADHRYWQRVISCANTPVEQPTPTPVRRPGRPTPRPWRPELPQPGPDITDFCRVAGRWACETAQPGPRYGNDGPTPAECREALRQWRERQDERAAQRLRECRERYGPELGPAYDIIERATQQYLHDDSWRIIKD